VEGSSLVLTEVLTQRLAGRTEENHRKHHDSVRTEILILHLLNVSDTA
jgi:hypothetical protein